MELIDNTNKRLKDDLAVEIKHGSKLSIAAACFSIYAFQELKAQLKGIDELRFSGIYRNSAAPCRTPYYDPLQWIGKRKVLFGH